jgi:hypothetical protein
MNILLIDIDSKIPNRALINLYSWHKAQGDQVGFNVSDPDIVYASVIFKKNKHLVDGLRSWYPNAEIVIGGSGYDLAKKLPHEIENIFPDYSLYPDMDYSLGFTTRGCIRNCYFCVVPKKEGHIQRWQHPKEFHDPRFKTIQLLDNNWLADREWFFETSNWIIDHDLKLIENGLDIRLLDQELAEQIARFKMAKPLKFAFDSMADKEAVLKGVELLKAAGVNVRQNVQFYVYVHDDNQYDSGVERCRILKQIGTNPFVMFNMDNLATPRIKGLKRWANRKWLFWSMDIEQYKAAV